MGQDLTHFQNNTGQTIEVSVLNAKTRQPIEGYYHGANVVLRPGDIYQVQTEQFVENVIWEAKIA